MLRYANLSVVHIKTVGDVQAKKQLLEWNQRIHRVFGHTRRRGTSGGQVFHALLNRWLSVTGRSLSLTTVKLSREPYLSDVVVDR